MSAKKKIWIISAIVIILAAVIAGGVYFLNSSQNASEISVEEAQSFVNTQFDELAKTDVTEVIAEKNAIKVENISYGSEKNIILECSVETVDVYAAVSPVYDEFLSAEAKKPSGMYKSKTDFQKDFSGRLTELIEGAEVTRCKCTIEIFDTDDGLKIFADPQIVAIVYGGVDKISADVSGRTTYTDESGNEQKIGSTNITKGLIESFEVSSDDRRPDTGNYFVRAWNSFKYDFNRIFIESGNWKEIFKGLWVTLQLTFCALIIGVVLGFVVAFIRCTYIKLGKKNIFLRLLNFISGIYISVIRGTPAMVQIMIIYFVIFMPMGVNKFTAAVVCFGLNSGAYVAEIVRGGIMSIDEGQTEAGRSLGFGYLPTMFYIILPQAFKAVLPALANEFIVLLKETSIAFYIGLGDLMYAVNSIRAATYTQFMPLIAAALIYLILVLVLTKLVGILERRLRNNER